MKKIILMLVIAVTFLPLVLALPTGLGLSNGVTGPYWLSSTKLWYNTLVNCHNISVDSGDPCNPGGAGGAVDYTKVQNYTSSACGAGQCVYDRYQNGTFLCRACSGGSGGTNYWEITGNTLSINATATSGIYSLNASLGWGNLTGVPQLGNTTAEIFAVCNNGSFPTITQFNSIGNWSNEKANYLTTASASSTYETQTSHNTDYTTLNNAIVNNATGVIKNNTVGNLTALYVGMIRIIGYANMTGYMGIP